MNRILVAYGENRQLMELFGVSHVTVREALRGSLSSPLAMRIRTAAIKRGGIEVKSTN